VPDDQTPPHGTPAALEPVYEPPRPLPTVLNTYNLLCGVAGQIEGLRTDVDTLLRRVPEPPVVEPVALEAAPTLPVPVDRPSRLAQAAHGAGFVGKVVLSGTGALTLITTVMAIWDDPAYAPAVQALKVLGRWCLRRAGVELP
jgi:hypothetical protein